MIIEDYKKNLLTNVEQKYVLQCFEEYEKDSKTYLSNIEYDRVNKELIDILISNKNILAPNQVFSFAPCATDIIDKLFKQYVDDDTLVITTKQEHPKVDKILKTQKNLLYLFDDCKFNINIFQLPDIIAHYKKIFIYVIGTTCCVGKRTDQSQLIAVKHIAEYAHIPSVFVLDAVQELFMLPRDYSIFDYVIGTAHAIIPEYNCGIVISKEQPYCKNQKAIAMKFSNLLQIVLKRKHYLSNFSRCLHEEFKEFIDKFQLSSNYSSGHLYSIGDIKGTLLPIIPESQHLFKTMRTNRSAKNILFRGCWSIFDPVGDDIHIDEDNQFFNMRSTTKEFLENLKK